MGTVHEARDFGLNRMVALEISIGVDDAHTLRHEAQGLAAVHHPNLVRVHALTRDDGVDFLVMERIQGMTLEERIAALALTTIGGRDARDEAQASDRWLPSPAMAEARGGWRREDRGSLTRWRVGVMISALAPAREGR